MKRIIRFMLCLILAIGGGMAAAQSAPSTSADSLLTPRRQSIVHIASATGCGDLEALKPALATGLDNGLTVNEIREVLIHAYAYCGFPRSLRALQTFIGVLDGRKAKGIKDTVGRDASPVEDSRSRYERGRDILAEISGVPASAPKAAYAEFAPAIERFLKEHLFADLFERDVLTYADRELATVSVIAALGESVEPMLRSHMGICRNLGMTEGQLRQALDIAAAMTRPAGGGRTLVAYFSAEGHTKAVAERIAALTGADIFRIEAARPYAENPYDDSDRVQEEAYKDRRPAVKELPAPETMARYDTIFVGSPIWWHQPAMVVCTFLEACDLRGKTVIPFFTYGATSYLNESMQKIYRLTPESKHIPASLPEDLDPDDITRPGHPDDAGIDMPEDADGTEAWLRRLGIIK